MNGLWNAVTTLARKFGDWIAWSSPPSTPDQPKYEPDLPSPIVPTPSTEWRPAQVAPPTAVGGDAADKIPAGSFIHFEDILKDIPECRRLLKSMRKTDKDAYDFHSKVGARVVSERLLVERDLIRKEFVDALPASGMVYLPARYESEGYCNPRFIYFNKVEAKPDYCGIPADSLAIYRVGVAYLEVASPHGENKKRRSGYFQYLMSVRPDRTAVLLKEALRETISTPHYGHYKLKPIGNGRWTRNKQQLSRGKAFTRTYSGYAPVLDSFVRDFEKRKRSEGIFGHIPLITPQDVASALFRFPASEYASSACEDFQVRAERFGISVAFSVAMGRTPYFFKDRQTEVTTDGKRRRIFHAVVEHKRVGRSGKVSTVKAHYRGERKFMWHDEKITITRPERSVATFGMAATEYGFDEDIPADMADMAEVGTKVRDALEAA